MPFDLETFWPEHREILATRDVIVVSDVDRTLTDPEKGGADIHLLPGVLPAADKLAELGIPFVPSSSRPIKDLKPAFAAAARVTCFISSDGSLITHDGAETLLIDRPDLAAIMPEVNSFTAKYQTMTASDMDFMAGIFVNRDNHPADHGAAMAFLQGMRDKAGAHMKVTSHKPGVTLEPENLPGKAKALERIIENLPVQNPFVICLGDDKNDEASQQFTKTRGDLSIKINDHPKDPVPDFANKALITSREARDFLIALAQAKAAPPQKSAMATAFPDVDWTHLLESVGNFTSLDELSKWIKRNYPGLAYTCLLSLANNDALVTKLKDLINERFDKANPATIGKDLGISRFPLFFYPSLAHALVANSSNLTVGILSRLEPVHGGATFHILVQTKGKANDWTKIFGYHHDVLVVPDDPRDGEAFFINSSIDPTARSGGEPLIKVLATHDLRNFDPVDPVGIDRCLETAPPGFLTSARNTTIVGSIRKDKQLSFAALMASISGQYDTRIVASTHVDAPAFQPTHDAKICLRSSQRNCQTCGSDGNHGGPGSCAHLAAVAVDPEGRLHNMGINAITAHIFANADKCYKCDVPGKHTADFYSEHPAFVPVEAEEALRLILEITTAKGLASALPGRLSFLAQYDRFAVQPEIDMMCDVRNYIANLIIEAFN